MNPALLSRCVAAVVYGLLISLPTVPVVAAEEEPGLQEVVVTAQRRSERLQDVGISIAAFSGDTLKDLGAARLSDVTRFVPNVSLDDIYGGQNPVWVIRGVGLRDYNPNNTPASAVYVDDVYQTSTAMGSMGLFDIERIEVLKGPQGGLYGRNTTGGAVLINSAKPALGSSAGFLTVGFGQYNRWDVEGAQNLPLSDTVAARLSAHIVESGAQWQRSLSTGRKWGAQDAWGLRGQVLAAPTSNVDVLVKVYGGKDRSATTLARAIGVWDPNAVSALGADVPGAANGYLNLQLGAPGPYLCAALLAGRRDNNSCMTGGGIIPSAQGNDPDLTLSDPINRLNNRSYGGSATVTVRLADLTFTSISAYDGFKFGQVFDFDGETGEFSHQLSEADIASWSQEFRLTSGATGPVSWMVGATYGHDRIDDSLTFAYKDNGVLVDVFGLPPAVNVRYNQATKSGALYGQGEWRFAPQWSLVAELRYTDERKEFASQPTVFVSGTAGLFKLAIPSGKLGINWKPAEDVLLYASASRGFKSGGFFGGVAFDTGGLNSYKAETVWAYETGFKTAWLGRKLTLNGDVFYYDNRNFQGFGSIPTTLGVNADVLTNIGTAHYKGAELEVAWAPVTGLTVQAGVGFLDEAAIVQSSFISGNAFGTGTTSLTGARLPDTPRWDVNALVKYAHALRNDWLWSAQLDYTYKAAYDLGVVRAPEDYALFHEGGYGIGNARLAVKPAGEMWELAATVSNIADVRYRLAASFDSVGNFYDIYSPPRTWGVQLSHRW